MLEPTWFPILPVARRDFPWRNLPVTMSNAGLPLASNSWSGNGARCCKASLPPKSWNNIAPPKSGCCADRRPCSARWPIPITRTAGLPASLKATLSTTRVLGAGSPTHARPGSGSLDQGSLSRMNAELEALILAYAAMIQASGEDCQRLRSLYEARLDDVLSRHSNVSRERLHRAVRQKYSRWLAAQQKPSSLPPKA